MDSEEIQKLLDDYKACKLPEVVVERCFMLALVESGDPMFLLRTPEPFRSGIVRFGLEVTDQWHEVSNNGMVDYSRHAPKLHELVVRFMREVPVGKHIQWKYTD